jgi:hypothetical protein
MAMKRIFLLAVALVMSAGTASAAMTTQKWTPGWDIFSEPLDFTHSNVKWSVSLARKLTVTYTLVGAQPNKLYQVDLVIFCTTFPATFGQFPVQGGGGACPSLTRQGVTRTAVGVELGVVTTDLHGKGSFKIIVGPIPSGSYEVEFGTRNGAGCDLTGGGGNTFDTCALDFQSPGPTFGTNTTTIIVP